MSLRIVKCGAFDIIQDLGRYGFQYLGINPGGAMDAIAAQVTNLLVGNDVNEAVIELHFPASSFLLEQDAVIALSGADFCAVCNDYSLPLNTPVIIKKYSLLQFTKNNSGARCYLAVKSGFDLPEWLNSYSTHLKAKTGGFHGRCLKKDDKVPVRENYDYAGVLKDKDCLVLTWKADIASLYSNQKTIRICSGAAYNSLTDSSKKHFATSSFTITNQSDRMGYRLKGESLELLQRVDLISSAVTKGTIQLLPNGQMIILMADHQTTGGYPAIAHVISADIPSLAQRQPNETIQFQFIDHSEAEELLWQQHQYLQVLQNACTLQLTKFLEEHHVH